MLNTTGRNRIYAITRKNRIVTSFFCVLTMSQFIFGLYITGYAAKGGGESMTKGPHNIYLLQPFSGADATDPTSSLYSMHNRGTVVLEHRIYRHVSRIRCENFLALHLGDIRFNYPPDFLAFSVVVYLVVRSNIYKVPIPGLLRTIAQDATYYFLVIFTSHLLLVLFLLFASVRISSQFSTISLRLAQTFVA